VITALTDAIKTLYDAAGGATLRAANTGGMFWQQAPQAAQEPYTVYSIVASSVDDQMGGTDARIEKFDVQFAAISRAEDGGVELADIVRKIEDWFDEAVMPVSGFSHLRNERNGIAPIIVVDKVWQSTILYTVWISWS
jgi:hypothetical protein